MSWNLSGHSTSLAKKLKRKHRRQMTPWKTSTFQEWWTRNRRALKRFAVYLLEPATPRKPCARQLPGVTVFRISSLTRCKVWTKLAAASTSSSFIITSITSKRTTCLKTGSTRKRMESWKKNSVKWLDKAQASLRFRPKRWANFPYSVVGCSLLAHSDITHVTTRKSS